MGKKIRKSEKLEELNDLRSQSTLFYIDNGTPKFSIHNRSYEPTPKKIKRSKALFLGATLASGLLRVMPSLANKAIKADANRPQHKRNLTKGLEVVKEGTFWAQPDYIWTKKIGKTFSKLGYHSKMYQNSYFIPEGDNKVSVFTKRIFELIQEYQLHFFMFDILYVPKDEPFILSPSRNSGGFYVNTTFMDKTNKEDLLYCYSLLNELAFEMGGNLNLAKNCFIKPELLEKMYAANLAEMVLLKQKYDPISLITSSFFEDYFPHYFPIQKQPH